jgi:hypothetical protein
MAAMVVMGLGEDAWAKMDVSRHPKQFGHAAAALLGDTRGKLDAIARREPGVRVAVLVSTGVRGGTIGPARSSSRSRLMLLVDGQASMDLRQRLLELAGALSDELRGSGATVCLRFTEAPRNVVARSAGR